MIGIRCAAGFVAALLTASAATAAPTVTWGRAGVPLATYRSDAVDCGRAGADRDIRGEKATADFIAAERALDRNLNLPSPAADNDGVGMIRRRYQPDRRIAELQRTLVSATERCLTGRGYVRFRLTSEQDRRLDGLRRGSEARRAYLHRLASDPEVLARQVIGEPPARSR